MEEKQNELSLSELADSLPSCDEEQSEPAWSMLDQLNPIPPSIVDALVDMIVLLRTEYRLRAANYLAENIDKLRFDSIKHLEEVLANLAEAWEDESNEEAISAIAIIVTTLEPKLERERKRNG